MGRELVLGKMGSICSLVIGNECSAYKNSKKGRVKEKERCTYKMKKIRKKEKKERKKDCQDLKEFFSSP